MQTVPITGPGDSRRFGQQYQATTMSEFVRGFDPFQWSAHWPLRQVGALLGRMGVRS